MLVPMMNIRVVGMRVLHLLMDMQVRMRLDPVPVGAMEMAMMQVMHVRMRMLQAVVQVHMFVRLR